MATSSEATGDQANPNVAQGIEITLPPPVNNQRTDKGSVVFDNLVLPAAPPMYRPYVLMDLEEKTRLAKTKATKKESESIVSYLYQLARVIYLSRLSTRKVTKCS